MRDRPCRYCCRTHFENLSFRSLYVFCQHYATKRLFFEALENVSFRGLATLQRSGVVFLRLFKVLALPTLRDSGIAKTPFP